MKRRARQHLDRAFTIVELLVATAVFVFLILIVAQMVDKASRITTSSHKRLDADSQARLIFDRMAIDIGKMVKRGDNDTVFAKLDGGNDAMFFFSEAPAFSSDSKGKGTTALIGYRITFNNKFLPNRPLLERLGKGLSWDGKTSDTTTGGMIFLTTPSGSATPTNSSTIPGNWTTLGALAGNNNCAYGDGKDTDYDVLSDLAYRMELAFLLKDGSMSTKPILSTAPTGWPSGSTYYYETSSDPTVTSDSTAGYAVGSRWYNTTTQQGYICRSAAMGSAIWDRIGVQDVTAIIVGLALLDSLSQKIIPASSYKSMIATLPDPSAGDLSATPPKLMAQTWTSVMRSPSFAQDCGIPKAAAGQIRIYQRYFYLNGN